MSKIISIFSIWSFILFFFINNLSGQQFKLDFSEDALPDIIRINEENFSPIQFHIEQYSTFPNNEKSEQALYVDIGSHPNQTDMYIFSIDLSDKNIHLDSLTTFSWRWKIKNINTADGIFIRFYSNEMSLFSIGSHTGYTFIDMLICNEKNGVWSEHKINLYDVFFEKINNRKLLGKKITKIQLITIDAISQGFWLDYMMFEQLPADQSDKVVNYYFVNNSKREQSSIKPVSACFVDIDRDDDQDIFIVNQDKQNFVRLNNGHGIYGNPIFLNKELNFVKNSYAMFVDINDDGWPDLFEGRENAENQLFLNKGDMRFELYHSFHAKDSCFTQTYATLWGDFNHNGTIEFIEIYPSFSTVNSKVKKTNICLNFTRPFNRKNIGFIAPYFGGSIADIDSDGLYEMFAADNRQKNHLFKLTKELNLKVISDTIFLDTPFLQRMNNRNKGYGWTEGSAFLDIDNDGDLDLYICNDGDPNQLYIWEENRYIEHARDHFLDDSLASEGFLIADFDNDMDWDIYILHTRNTNRLMLNDGKGYFYDGTTASGFEHPGGSVGGICGDVDNDGDIDVYLVDPYKGEQLLINPINNNSFFKLKLRGQSENYDGIRAKIYLFKGDSVNNRSLIFHHQITCGDGFQYDAFPREFHFGIIPDTVYIIKVVFDDGKEVIQKIDIGQKNLVIYPANSSIIKLFNNFLYHVREPFLIWLRTIPISFIIIFLFLWALTSNFITQYIISRKRLKYSIILMIVFFTTLFMADLKTIGMWEIIFILFIGAYFPEFIIIPIRKLLNKYYVHESTWDRLYEHLKAFRHGGVAINNMDRIIFLFQNISEFEGDFKIYQNRILDAVRTYNNQTSWQLSELVYILRDVHWDRNIVLNLKNNQKKLLQIFNKILSSEDGCEIYSKNSNYVLNAIKHIETNIDQIYSKIIKRFSCDPYNIIIQTINSKYSKTECHMENKLQSQAFVKIKGYELGNIIADLLENGLRSTEDREHFQSKIKIQKNDGYIVIDISDNGSGIPKMHHKKIFEKGYTTRKTDGGFGLFYALETLQKYGGEIFVLKSEKNIGTTIRMILKIVNREQEIKK